MVNLCIMVFNVHMLRALISCLWCFHVYNHLTLNCLNTSRVVVLEIPRSLSYPDVFDSEHEYQEPSDTSRKLKKEKKKDRREKKNDGIIISAPLSNGEF